MYFLKLYISQRRESRAMVAPLLAAVTGRAARAAEPSELQRWMAVASRFMRSTKPLSVRLGERENHATRGTLSNNADSPFSLLS